MFRQFQIEIMVRNDEPCVYFGSVFCSNYTAVWLFT